MANFNIYFEKSISPDFNPISTNHLFNCNNPFKEYPTFLSAWFKKKNIKQNLLISY